MTTTEVLGPYESRSVYRDLHSGPTGREWAAFVAECNGRLEGDGAAPAATSPLAVAAIAPQPAPSPLDLAGGVR